MLELELSRRGSVIRNRKSIAHYDSLCTIKLYAAKVFGEYTLNGTDWGMGPDEDLVSNR